MKKKTEKNLLWATLGILILSTLLSALAIFVGGITFSNPLPSNPFDNKSELVMLIIAPFQLLAGFSALMWSLKMFFGEDWETVTYDKNGREVNRDKFDGCITQLMVAIGVPILAALITYMVLYYLIYLFMQVASFLLPILIPAAMVLVLVLFGWSVLRGSAPEAAPAKEEPVEGEKSGWWSKLTGLVARHKRLIVAGLLTLIYLASAIALLDAGFSLFSESETDSPHHTDEADAHYTVTKRNGKSYFECDYYGKSGSLQLGKPFVDHSSSDEGFYNRIERTTALDKEGNSCYDLNLYMNDEHVAHIRQKRSERTLTAYTIFTERVSLPNGIHPGMSLHEAMETGEVYATATYYPEKGTFGLEVTSCGRLLLTEKEAMKALSDRGLERCQRELSASNLWLNLEAKDFKKDCKVSRLHISL